jgi:hypothetical protein
LSSAKSYRASHKNKIIAQTHVRAALARPSGIHQRAITATAMSTHAALNHSPIIDGKNGAIRIANPIMLAHETIRAIA